MEVIIDIRAASKIPDQNYTLSEEELVSNFNIRKKLRRRFSKDHSPYITVLYPGAGQDLWSFWHTIDADIFYLVDPVLMSLGDNIYENVEECKKSFASQLNKPDLVFENVTYDLRDRKIIDDSDRNWIDIKLSDDRSIIGDRRVAFTAKTHHMYRERIIIYVVDFQQNFQNIRECQNESSAIIPSPVIINSVYEHKSNVPFEVLVGDLSVDGCVIWGLPDNAPTVQWVEKV